MPTYVLYHANCPDGFGAALACWQKFGDRAEYLPVRYNEPPPDMEQCSYIYIVDFSYPAAVLESLADYGRHHITVLDHHETAEAELSGLSHPNIITRFDIKESGATLTWKYFFGDYVPIFFQYLRDRDLYLWEFRGSKQFSAALASHPKGFNLWQSFIGNEGDLIAEGESIFRYQHNIVRGLRKQAELSELDGHRIMVCNTPVLGSEVGNNLCEHNPDIDFAVCYSKQEDGSWRYELRSIGEFDVSHVAKQHGGGGHKNAAGFVSRQLEV